MIHDFLAVARQWVFAGAAVALAACNSLPKTDALPSHAFEASVATTLDGIAQASLDPASTSGFQLLPVASAAYETRLALANQAKRSPDVQTFIFSADDTGRYLLDALKAAAVRGVRVRLPFG